VKIYVKRYNQPSLVDRIDLYTYQVDEKYSFYYQAVTTTLGKTRFYFRMDRSNGRLLSTHKLDDTRVVSRTFWEF